MKLSKLAPRIIPGPGINAATRVLYARVRADVNYVSHLRYQQQAVPSFIYCTGERVIFVCARICEQHHLEHGS